MSINKFNHSIHDLKYRSTFKSVSRLARFLLIIFLFLSIAFLSTGFKYSAKFNKNDDMPGGGPVYGPRAPSGNHYVMP